jgi:heat shock protein HslJ
MKARVTIILICGVILALLFAGCTTQPQTLPATTSSPIIGKWTLISFAAGMTTNVLAGTTITATFSDGGTVSGSAGCNNYLATYQVQNTKLTIGKPETSNTTCNSPTGIMDQEAIYLSNLQGTGSYAINGDLLTVYDLTGKILLTYQKAGS